MATAAKTAGMSRSAYNEALKAAQTEQNLAEYRKSLELSKERRAAALALVRDLREVSVRHFNAPGSSYVNSAIQEATYQADYEKNNITSTEARIAKLEGQVVVEDDDE